MAELVDALVSNTSRFTPVPVRSRLRALIEKFRKYVLPVFRQRKKCDPGAIRTPNQQNRNLPFYPLNYGAIFVSANVAIRF